MYHHQGQLSGAFSKEKSWLEKYEIEKGDTVAWSASMLDVTADLPNTLTQLLTPFYENAAAAAMVKHGMNVLRVAAEFLNPPVVAFDAPLYAITKFTQWKWCDTHGEEKFIVIFSGLHIEMAMRRTSSGDYLEVSGWTMH